MIEKITTYYSYPYNGYTGYKDRAEQLRVVEGTAYRCTKCGKIFASEHVAKEHEHDQSV